MIFTMRNRKHKIRIWAVAVWLGIWQLASLWIGQEILLVSPFAVFRRLAELALAYDFWRSVLSSVIRITGGFLGGAAAGAAAAGFAFKFRRVEELLEPFVLTIKAAPVASFIILILIWIPSRNLSMLISFLMVFPIIYTNVLEGAKSMDIKLLEMARVFRLSRPIRLKYLYFPQIVPYFQTGCSLGLGLGWKAGVAAEVIGIPENSIGEQLYNAKIYLNTADLFAWTLVIILLSFVFERVLLYLIGRGRAFAERMR